MKTTMRIITVPETGIRIGVTNAEEMYRVFFRLGVDEDLEIEGKLYPAGEARYTKGYFEANYFKGN